MVDPETPAETPPPPPPETSGEKPKNIKDVFCEEIIKSFWTHEPWLYFKVIVKSNDFMGDYIALHGLVPQNELPMNMRNQIPPNEIWMREDVYNDVPRRKRILTHEYVELELMVSRNMTYQEAHARAEFYEDIWYEEFSSKF